MPMSPRSPPRMGFMPIRNNGRSDSSETDIPLTNVPTASSTGARKQTQTAADMSATTTETSEKKSGLFHRKSKNEKEEAGIIGRRKAVKTLAEEGRQNSWGDEMGLNAMGRLYYKIINFSSVTRYMVYVAPVAILLAIPLIIIGVTGHINDTFVGGSDTDVHRPKLFDLFLWIEVSWLCLWGGKIVAGLLPAVFMFFCGVVSSGTRKYATVIKNLEIPISLLLWALASWLVFRFKFQHDSQNWVDIMTKILGSLWVSSCVFLGEKAIIQLISISYHQRSFANRIRESKRDIFLLGLMYEASRTLFPMYCEEFAEEDYCISDSIEAMLMGGKKKRRGFHKKSGSLTPNINPMNLVGEVGRFGDKITSVFGNIASEITGKQVFNPNSAHSIVIEALEKVRSSEALARRIWMSFVVEGKDALYVDDVAEVLGPGHHEEAEECFAAVDADENGDISLDEMVRKVVEIGKERKSITNSMKDIGQALKVLDSILLFIVLLIVVIIFLSFFQSSFVNTLAGAGTALISLSFAISTTCQEFLGSIIFLFVKHPYDVGDRIEVSGESLIVEKISLLYTVFTSLKEMQVTQVPNIVLNNLWIDNLSRSKAMKESVEVNISYDTSFEDVELLRLEMEKFVRHPDNSRDFQQDLVIGVGGVGDCDKLTLKIVIKHKSNWHNEAVRATRRSKFMCALALALKKVPIFGPGGGGAPALGSSDNPAYSVAIDDKYAVRAREKAANEADAARMVPHLKPKRSDSGSTTGRVHHVSEQQAVQELNTRPPLAGLDSHYGYDRDGDGNLDAGNRDGSPTLNSRDTSQDRQRTENIEQIRAGLIQRHSTRGRRKAGEGVPSTPLGEGQPGIAVTQYGSDGNVILSSDRQFSYDIPDQAGSQHYGSSNIGSHGAAYGPLSSHAQVSPGVAAAARESYSLYEGAGRYASPPGSGPQPTGYGRELTPGMPGTTPGSYSAELDASGANAGAGASGNLAPAARGARPRGASVSSAAEEREQAAGQAGQRARKQYTK